ncbi:MAG TPA: hypothetical protein VG223_10125 [Solirubrobacteraceae bacterium]|nr:hypothetical protein [Solirubrobacteraceae bacterium]
MTTFFIPGLPEDPHVLETAYRELRARVERDVGHRPSAKRIFRLWTRRGRTDCITEVGRADPLLGSTVIAIFDLGTRLPFIVCRQPDDGMPEGACEVLGPSAYSVVEFDS